MKPFKFRAAAALDLRQKQEDEARLAHAAAEIAARAADARVLDAREATARAEETSASSVSAGIDAWLMTWHRVWIDRLRLEVGARQAEAAISAADLQRAAASMQKAHQRRRTLERLRDRNRQRYEAEVRQNDLKEMNLFAGLRFIAGTADERDNE